MKLKNYPLTVLFIVGMALIGCEATRRESINEARANQVPPVAVADTVTPMFYELELTETQIDSVWSARGY